MPKEMNDALALDLSGSQLDVLFAMEISRTLETFRIRTN